MVFNVCNVKVSMLWMEVSVMEVSVRGRSATLMLEHLHVYNSHPGTELSGHCTVERCPLYGDFNKRKMYGLQHGWDRKNPVTISREILPYITLYVDFNLFNEALVEPHANSLT